MAGPLTPAIYAAVAAIIKSKSGQAAIEKFGKTIVSKYRKMRAAKAKEDALATRLDTKNKRAGYNARLDPSSTGSRAGSRTPKKTISEKKTEIINQLKDKSLTKAEETVFKKRLENLNKMKKDPNALTGGKMNKGGLATKKKKKNA